MTHNQFTILVKHRPLLIHLSKYLKLVKQQRHGFSATHLVLEECIPDILRHSRHSQDVTLTFLISIDANTIVEHDAVIHDQLESSRKELAQSRAEIDLGHLLEQLRPSFVLVFIPESIITALL